VSASPVSAAGRIYFLDDKGVTTVIEASPKFKVLAKNSLGGRVQSSLAIANGRIFLRTDRELYCIGPG
jgi:outer membrane protein assembly factor BamB